MNVLSEEQKDWVVRRDYFCCNFYHPQSGPYKFFCCKDFFSVYFISFVPISQKILWPWLRLEYQFISLCSHHYLLMERYSFQKNWQKDLFRIAKINTMYYKVHAPEDIFPT